MKRSVSVLIALSVLLGMMNIDTAAKTAFNFEDDFESCEIMSAPDTGKDFTVGNWAKSAVWRGSGYRGVYMKTQILQYPSGSENKVMSVTGYGSTSQACMNLIADTSTLTGSAILRVDGCIPQKKADAAYGMRAMVSEDEKSFYELYIPKQSNKFSFRKVVSGTESFSHQLDMTDISSEEMFTMELKISDNSISYSVTCSGTVYKDSYTDTEPFASDLSEAKVQLGVMGDSTIYYDNVKYKVYDPYQDNGLPENMLYYDEADNAEISAAENDTVIAFKDPVSIRRFVLRGADDISGAAVYGANEEDFSDEILLAAEGSAEAFGDASEIVNRASSDTYRYYRILNAVSEEIEVYREIVKNETIVVDVGTTVGFISRFSGVDGNGEWSIDNDRIAELQQNGIYARRKGSTDVTVSNGTLMFGITLQVLSEMEAAITKGKTEAYIELKRPVVDAVNNAIDSKDISAMKAVITNEIPKILDIDAEMISKLNDGRLSVVAEQMLDCSRFGGQSIEISDIEKLISEVDKAIAVALLNNEPDADKILERLGKYGAVYGINTKSQYYMQCLNEIAQTLKNTNFVSAEQIAAIVENTYVMSAFDNAQSSWQYKAVIENNADEIGFDFEKYDALSSTQKLNLMYEISDKREDITDINGLKEMIDGYAPEYYSDGGSSLFDDFNSYELVEHDRKDAVQQIGNNWKNSNVYRGSGWMDTYMSTAIVNSPKPAYDGDKAIRISGYGVTSLCCVDLIADRTGISSDTYAKTDIYLSGTTGIRSGIRAGVSADEKSYYELATAMDSTAIVFRKVENDTEVYNIQLPVSAEINSWMTFSVGIAGNTIVYKVTSGKNTYTGEYYDESAFVRSGNDGFMQLMLHGDSKLVYMDNVEYRDLDIYTESSVVPKNMIYINAAYGKAPVNGILSIGKLRNIRKMRLVSENEAFPAGIKVYLSNEQNLSDKRLIAESQQQEGNIWEFYNRTTNEPYRYVVIEGSGIAAATAFVETDEQNIISLTSGDRVEAEVMLDYSSDSVEWSANNPSVSRVEGGKLCAYTEGVSIITAKNELGSSRSVTVNVKGELSEAEKNGTVSEYLSEKMPVIKKINDAIKAKNRAAILDVLKSDISQIRDFNITMLDDITDSDLTLMSERIANGTPFENAAGGVDAVAVHRLIDVFSGEAAVASISSRKDGYEVEEMLTRYSSYYGTDLSNKYYTANAEAVCAAMSSRTYKSPDDVNKVFKSSYTFAAFSANKISLRYRQIIEDNSTVIGYDQSKYDKLYDKSALYDSIARDKSAIADLDALRVYIDNFTSKTNNSSNSGGSSGGSSGTSGMPSIGVTGDSGNLHSDAPQTSPYSDVPVEHWAYEYIVALSAKGIVNGYDGGYFAPDKTVTRAEFIKILVQAFNMQSTEESAAFADVNENDWYYESVSIAAANGVLHGDNGMCNPQSPITREEMAVLVYRSMPEEERSNGALNAVMFNDDALISDWAFGAVKRLQEKGIIDGMDDGSFMPKSSVTRAQAAKVIKGATD